MRLKVRPSSQTPVRLGAVLITGCALLGACSSTEPVDTTDPVDTTEPAVTTAPVDSAEPVDTIEVRLEIGPCRNSGELDALGMGWLHVGPATGGFGLLPEGWQGLEHVDGVLEFESFEESTFTAAGESILVSTTRDVELMCVDW